MPCTSEALRDSAPGRRERVRGSAVGTSGIRCAAEGEASLTAASHASGRDTATGCTPQAHPTSPPGRLLCRRCRLPRATVASLACVPAEHEMRSTTPGAKGSSCSSAEAGWCLTRRTPGVSSWRRLAGLHDWARLASRQAASHACMAPPPHAHAAVWPPAHRLPLRSTAAARSSGGQEQPSGAPTLAMGGLGYAPFITTLASTSGPLAASLAHRALTLRHAPLDLLRERRRRRSARDHAGRRSTHASALVQLQPSRSFPASSGLQRFAFLSLLALSASAPAAADSSVTTRQAVVEWWCCVAEEGERTCADPIGPTSTHRTPLAPARTCSHNDVRSRALSRTSSWPPPPRSPPKRCAWRRCPAALRPRPPR